MSDLMSPRAAARPTSSGARRGTGARAALRAVGEGEEVPAVSTPTRDWCTPPALVAAVREAFGGTIDLDPCSNEHSLVGAVHEYRLPEDDGLAAPWDAQRIFVNPPTGRDLARGTRIADWFARIAEAVRAGSEVIALVPVATNTAAWKDHVYPFASSICFLSASRVKFHLDGREDPKGAPMACAVIYFGQDVDAFEAAFTEHGTCLRTANAASRSVSEEPETDAAVEEPAAEDRTLDAAASTLVARALAVLDQRSPILPDLPLVQAPPVSTAPTTGDDAPPAGFALSLFEALDGGGVPHAEPELPSAPALPPLSRAGRQALRRTLRRTEKKQRKAARLLERSAALTGAAAPAGAHDDSIAPSLAARLARRP